MTHHGARLIMLVLLASACGGGKEDVEDFTPDAGRPDATPIPDAGTPDAAAPFLYEPPVQYAVDVMDLTGQVSYVDALGAVRDVPIAVYVPVGAVGARPIVLVSHGGSGGHTNPLTSLPEWASLVASAGYVAIAI